MLPFNPEQFLSTIALIGTVIVISALLSGLLEKSGLPQVAAFLGLGAAIGPLGLGLMNVDVHSPILRVVATLSLVLVLFTDAVSLNLKDVRRSRLLSFLVIGPGTLFSGILIALFAGWLLHLPLGAALILGAALASTDPVMLRALLSRPGLDAGVRQALHLEGGMNDAVLLPMVLVGMALLRNGPPPLPAQWAHFALDILVLSPAAGMIVGLAAVGMLELVRRRLGVRRDYESIYSLGVAFAAYAAAESIHGSGFLAAFAAGVTISALDVELCDCFLEYGETTAEMALMFTFVLFGMSVIWGGLGTVGIATLLFVLAAFLSRPLAFIPALLPARLTWKNRALIAWFGPRGLSSLLLILLPVFAGLPLSGYLLSICCLVVLCSVVLHGISPSILIPSPPDQASHPPVIQPVPLEAADPVSRVTPIPQAESKLIKLTTPDAGTSGFSHSEYLSIPEIEQLRAAGNRVLIIDARTERTYEDSGEWIPGSVRLPPEEAVRTANRLALPKEAILAVLCA